MAKDKSDDQRDKRKQDDDSPWDQAVQREEKDANQSGRKSGASGSSKTRAHQKEGALPSRAAAVHERLRVSGEKELERDVMALVWSAIAAGISMSASMMARGLLHAHLPENDTGFLISSVGYSLGFLIVVLARQQLFTENTVTAVLPFMSHPTLKSLSNLLRFWAVVLAGNILGAGIAGFTFLHLPMFTPSVDDAFVTIGMKLMENDPFTMFSKSIVAGWLIATMVWLMPSADQAKTWVILIITYAVAVGEFPHIIVGASEILYLVFRGDVSWTDFVLRFGLPTLGGNIVGGTFIFALISHAQIRNDMDVQREGRRGAWGFNRKK